MGVTAPDRAALQVSGGFTSGNSTILESFTLTIKRKTNVRRKFLTTTKKKKNVYPTNSVFTIHSPAVIPEASSQEQEPLTLRLIPRSSQEREVRPQCHLETAEGSIYPEKRKPFSWPKKPVATPHFPQQEVWGFYLWKLRKSSISKIPGLPVSRWSLKYSANRLWQCFYKVFLFFLI